MDRIVFLAFAIVSSATAGVVFTDLPGSGTFTGAAGPLSPITWDAVGVQTGGTAMQFNSFTGYFSDGLPAAKTLDGWIYSNSAGNPGSVVGTFVSQTVPGTSNASYTLLTSAAVTLSANTTYWFVLADAVGLAWRADTANASLGTVPAAANSSGWSLVGYKQTFDSGSAWSAVAQDFTVQIDASVVSSTPEPASGLLLACGAAFLFVRRRA